ncbi:DUF308 domain-containing protein [Leuconostocaceae bacterium ESL0958]|nr:DUF308 domain-containing protein [Leuconostocaceae bacterium ESL0958]
MLDNFALKFRRVIGMDGLVSTIVGILIVFWPDKSANFVAALIGIAMLLMGAFKLWSAFSGKENRRRDQVMDAIVAVVYLVAGLFIFIDMQAATLSLLLVVGMLTGITWLVEGIANLTILNRLNSSKTWHFIAALINILAGLSLIVSPLIGGFLVWTFFGIMLLVVGIIKLAHYFTLKK